VEGYCCSSHKDLGFGEEMKEKPFPVKDGFILFKQTKKDCAYEAFAFTESR